MSDNQSCIYAGEVVHQRFTPVRHRLRYSMFQMLFDLDELPKLSKILKLFSYNQFNVFSFRDRDHGDGGARPLRSYVERVLTQAGLTTPFGRIMLLCMPRIFGFVFNPLSIYYCFSPDGVLRAVLYEVNNTFGQRHSYVIPYSSSDDRGIEQSCDKEFYVSPFMDMEMVYKFKLSVPGPNISTIVNGFKNDGERLIFAAFSGSRLNLTDRTLFRTLVAFPFLTLGVVVAIHWEAAKLFAKGMRLRRRPVGPNDPVSIVPLPDVAQPAQ